MCKIKSKKIYLNINNMNINYSDLDPEEQNSYENFDYNEYEQSENNSQQYWEQKPQQPKKKKVSFDDILGNMNLVVNKGGVLQFMAPNQPQNFPNNSPQNSYNPNNYNNPQIYNPQQRPNEPALDPNVKHSFIYNKYFKDYKDVTVTPEVKVPKTMEEYKKMLLENKIERIKQKKRISEIKSTRLFFTTNTGQNGNINSSRNNLKNMSFT